MGKISPVSAKYIIHATIEISGVVDRPDVIGAIFGQTEGLLGAELELRELQRSGRIGRIEVNVETSSGKTKGLIEIPSSLDKSETSIVGAALEVIDRIGPCEARIKVTSVEDVRVSKREYIIERAKELLKELMDKSLPDSQQIADEVAQSVRVMELQAYGRERLPCGPAIDDSDEVIVVEGRADVINLLKHGIKNAIAMNGTNVPETIKKMSRGKVLTAFVDGDRGGDLIIKELLTTSDVDFLTKAPDGKEVEEITKKEIHKALRSRIAAEQYRLEHHIPARVVEETEEYEEEEEKEVIAEKPVAKPIPSKAKKVEEPKEKESREPKETSNIQISKDDREKLSEIADELIGTRAACLLNEKLEVLGKVPVSEITSTMKEMESKIFGIVLDDSVSKDLVSNARKSGVQLLIGKEPNEELPSTKVKVIFTDEL